MRDRTIERATSMLLVWWIWLAAMHEARAQGGHAGSIVGYVLDQSGAPLSGVAVTASSPTQIGGSKTTYSNAEGFFRFVALSPGEFQVRASAPRLKTLLQKDVLVGITAAAEVTLVMEVESGPEEKVLIIEKRPMVSTTSATIKEDFDLDLVSSLPHDNRDNVFAQMVNSSAGAVNGRVRGGAANQTMFTQDGFEMRNQYPTMRSSAAFEVSTGGYGAENPTAPGGAINLVTRSGSNRYEFEFNGTLDQERLRLFRDNGDARTTVRRYVINPSLSGPIVKDRLWFHFNHEYQRRYDGRERDVEGIFADPAAALVDVHKGTFKLTWQASVRHKLSALYNYDNASDRNRRGGALIHPDAQQDRKLRRDFIGLIWEALLTDRLLLRSQVAYLQIPESLFPSTCRNDPDSCHEAPPIVNNSPRRYEFGNANREERNDVFSWQFVNRVQWFTDGSPLGDHTPQLAQRFYIEEDVRRSTTPGDRLLEWNGAAPEAQTLYFSNDPRVEPARTGWFIGATVVRRNVVTLTDSWRATRNLTLTLGLSHVWAEGTDNRGNASLDQSALAPSLGVAWNATGDGKTVLRASFNQYVDVNVAALARHRLGNAVSQRCRWNATSGTYDNCSYSGGTGNNTVGLPCGQTGIDEQGRSCTEALKIPRTFEYTVGAERELIPDLAASIDVIYRKFDDQYEIRETNRIWNRSGSALAIGGGYRNGRAETVSDLGTPADAERRWMGATAGLNQRAGRLKLRASYTLSRLSGTVFDGTGSLFGDIPPRDVYLDGVLPDDHRHEVKLTGRYQFNQWLSTGARYSYLSGMPYSRFFRNDETGRFEDLRARVGYDPGANINDPSDDRALRMPDQQSLNMQLSVNWKPLVGVDLQTYADVLNVLALRTTTSVGQEDGRDFGVARARQGGTQVRLGLNFRY